MWVSSLPGLTRQSIPLGLQLGMDARIKFGHDGNRDRILLLA
jgi:hypothetical protein